jgi:heavy metal sensor kinase
VILPLPIRVRLTLWYSFIFATALFCLGFACLWIVHRAITQIEDGELQQRVRSVNEFLDAYQDKESSAQLRASFTGLYDVSHGKKWLQVIDEHGNWLYRSPHVAAVYPTLVLPGQAPQSGTYFTYSAESLHIRALIKPINVRGVKYTVQTGLTLDKTLGILATVRERLALLTLSGLLISSLAGYLMSRKALTPIAVIADEARRINDKNLNTRLPELATRDELAALSNTLNQMLDRIEAGYQSVRSFTANAAHELRTPVARLSAEAEVALAFPRDAAYYRDTCRRVLANSMQMTHLIDQLLLLARADANVEVLKMEPVNLPDLIAEVTDQWIDRFAEAHIEFSCEIQASEFWLDGDYQALARLLNILLENAWRYTSSGKSVIVALREHARVAGLTAAEISVEDTGIGISAQDQERIFERFCRVARPLHGEFSGSGLGLALAQWIAKRHGSVIELQSSPGEGSRFSIYVQRDRQNHSQPSGKTKDLTVNQPL